MTYLYSNSYTIFREDSYGYCFLSPTGGGGLCLGRVEAGGGPAATRAVVPAPAHRGGRGGCSCRPLLDHPAHGLALEKDDPDASTYPLGRRHRAPHRPAGLGHDNPAPLPPPRAVGPGAAPAGLLYLHLYGGIHDDEPGPGPLPLPGLPPRGAQGGYPPS